jgi:hypothetical protein
MPAKLKGEGPTKKSKDYNCQIKTKIIDRPLPDTLMTEIHSYTQPERSDSLYACGYQLTKVEVKMKGKPSEFVEVFIGAMFKMRAQSGEIDYLYSWGANSAGQINKCKLITYDQENKEVVMLLEATHKSLRPSL